MVGLGTGVRPAGLSGPCVVTGNQPCPRHKVGAAVSPRGAWPRAYAGATVTCLHGPYLDVLSVLSTLTESWGWHSTPCSPEHTSQRHRFLPWSALPGCQ